MESSSKIKKYEIFLNDVLRVDLKKEVQYRESVCERVALYSQLKQTLDCINKVDTTDGIQTQVNIGSNFYVQAHIPDPSRIYVDVGLGLHVELTIDEAKKFSQGKVDDLTIELEESSKRSSKIKSQIKFIMEALRELQCYQPKEL